MKKKFLKKCFYFFLVLNVGFFIFCGMAFAEDVQAAPVEPLVNQLISIDYKDAELSSVLRSLSYSYNLNLVATKDIKGKVTVALREVSIDDALSAILSVNGYTFTRKGSLIYITTGPGLEGIDLVTVALPIKYLTASEASSLLQKAISTKGDIRTNENTNSLLVTDLPANIEKLKSVLKEIDTQPIQVLIEAKLVDITEEDYKNLGLSWTVDYKPAGGGLTSTQSQEEINGTQTMAGPSSSLSGGQFKITTLALKSFPAGTVTLDALLQANKAHVLASPAIATLSGKEARIIIGERYPYKEQTQTTTGTTETIKFVDIGTTLRVTPQVSPDGWITMSVHPEVSSVKEKLDAGPRITTREADAMVRVKDGETVVIGGLIKREDKRTKGKIPILGNIPIVGWIFSKASTDLTSTELVVFITPRIIRNPEEAKAIEATRRSEVSLSLPGVGERITVNEMWQEARNLEEDEGIESRRKDLETRKAEALERYRQIALQFPGSEKADDALFSAGVIAYGYFADIELAKKIFSQLAEGYPDSPYVAKSKRMVRHVDKKLKAKEPPAPKEKKDFKTRLH